LRRAFKAMKPDDEWLAAHSKKRARVSGHVSLVGKRQKEISESQNEFSCCDLPGTTTT